MNYTIDSLHLVTPIPLYRSSRLVKSLSTKNPDTKGCTLELVDSGVLCTEADGRLHIIPLNNVSSMKVSKAEVVKAHKAKKSK